MAGGNLSPRQKMINLMYLVLTAMLALNVSAEILKAFADINSSLEKSNTTVESRVSGLYEQFAKKMDDEPEKTKPNFDKSQQIKALVADLNKVIVDAKTKLTDEGGNKNGKDDEEDYMVQDGTKRLKSESDIDISTRLLVEDPQGGIPQLGQNLKAKLDEFRNKANALLGKDAEGRVLIPDTKPTNDGKSWLESSFSSMPLAGAITVLTKLQNDLKNTEAETVQYLLGDIDKATFKFNTLAAKVIAPRNILQGQTAEAEILLVAYDSRQQLDITAGGSRVNCVDGVGKLTLSGSTVGEKNINGVITVPDPSGGAAKTYPFSIPYNVSPPAASVSPTKMNVFYIGLENPVSVSAAGVASNKVFPSISAGTISGGGSSYIVKVTTPGTVNVSVAAEVDGKRTQMGSFPFRVKYVPDPIPQAGGMATGQIASGTFKATGGIIATLKDFDFDLRFNIVRFRMIYLAARQDPKVEFSTGPAWTGTMQNYINSAKPGDTFIFDEIQARGPDGIARKLTTATYRLQ